MAGIPHLDLHIHTKYLGCANQTMEVAAIIDECKRAGVTALGITDHLNSLDKLELHEPILKAILSLTNAGVDIHYGVELNFLGLDKGFAYSQEVKEKAGFAFAIGGIHSLYLEEYDLKKLVDIQHRHHLKTCQDPLVDVLVHPYWFSTHSFSSKEWPWFDSMKAVPESYARELGQVARETNTAIEINSMANLCNPAYSEDFVREYIDYLAVIASEGPLFSCGSDSHDIGQLKDISETWRVAAEIGLTEDRIWRPRTEPVVSGGS